jgi:hypothetical protein
MATEEKKRYSLSLSGSGAARKLLSPFQTKSNSKLVLSQMIQNLTKFI